MLLHDDNLVLGQVRFGGVIADDARRSVSRRRLGHAHAGHHGRRGRGDVHGTTADGGAGAGGGAVDLEHFGFGGAAAAAAATAVFVPAVLVAVWWLVLDDDGAPAGGGAGGGRGPRQEDGRPACARVQEGKEQEKGADGAEDDAGNGAGRKGRVLLAVSRGDGLEAGGGGALLRRAGTEGRGGGW